MTEARSSEASRPSSSPGGGLAATPGPDALPLGPGKRPHFERLVGRVGDPLLGPTVLVVAGIHGNEPAGVLAARRVFARLLERSHHLRGELVVYSGNTRALTHNVRYLERDLNRGWHPERIAECAERVGTGEAGPEDFEQVELAGEIDSVLRRSRQDVYFLDLHTTSSDGYPFAMIVDGPERRRFALNFHLPIILGLLEAVDGVLLKYMTARGCLTLGIEGGQNLARNSIDHHEAVLWLALVASGLLAPAFVPELERQRGILSNISEGLPRILAVHHRHAITPEDRFQMQPGFANIHRVRTGTLLAHDLRGEIRASEDGIVFLPLYQAQGDDGFFFGREIHL